MRLFGTIPTRRKKCYFVHSIVKVSYCQGKHGHPNRMDDHADWQGRVAVCGPVSWGSILETSHTIKVVGEIQLESFRVCASSIKCFCAAHLTTVSNAKTDWLLLLFVRCDKILFEEIDKNKWLKPLMDMHVQSSELNASLQQEKQVCIHRALKLQETVWISVFIYVNNTLWTRNYTIQCFGMCGHNFKPLLHIQSSKDFICSAGASAQTKQSPT